MLPSRPSVDARFLAYDGCAGNNPAAAGGSAAIAGHIAGAMAAALSAPSPLAIGPLGAAAPQAGSIAIGGGGGGALVASRSGLAPGSSVRQALGRSFAGKEHGATGIVTPRFGQTAFIMAGDNRCGISVRSALHHPA